MLGPSGSGKTTLLNICAGYLHADAGQLLVAGRDITALAAAPAQYRHGVPELRAVSAYDVAENVAYGLRARRVGRAPSSNAASRQALARVQLDGLWQRGRCASFQAGSSSAWRWRAPW